VLPAHGGSKGGSFVNLSPKLVTAWQHLLGLCKVKNSETVLILVGEETNALHLAAARYAVSQLSAKLLTVELGEAPTGRLAGESTAWYGPTALSGNQPALEAMKCADLVIDLMGMYRGAEQEQILAAGTRIILVKEPPEVFMRLLPRAGDKARVQAAERMLSRDCRMVVRSDAGTDLAVAFAQYPCLVQYGFADEVGRWDHCPSAFIARWPDEGSSNGTVVLDYGDTILPFKDYVRTPIRLDIRDGYVRNIEGGFDAKYLREYMASFNDPEAYAVSHLGWGLHDRAHWTMLGMYDKRQSNAMDARSYEGNFMFSTGPNSEAGGSRHTACHLDIPISSCSVWVDDEQVVDRGVVMPEDQCGASARSTDHFHQPDQIKISPKGTYAKP
jgi:2,5-dihydroxypyridine 5,6-dioxygenase